MRDFFQKLIIAEPAEVSFPGGREMIRQRRSIYRNLPGVARVGTEKRGIEHAIRSDALRSELVQWPAALSAWLIHLRVFHRRLYDSKEKTQQWLQDFNQYPFLAYIFYPIGLTFAAAAHD